MAQFSHLPKSPWFSLLCLHIIVGGVAKPTSSLQGPAHDPLVGDDRFDGATHLLGGVVWQGAEMLWKRQWHGLWFVKHIPKLRLWILRVPRKSALIDLSIFTIMASMIYCWLWIPRHLGTDQIGGENTTQIVPVSCTNLSASERWPKDLNIKVDVDKKLEPPDDPEAAAAAAPPWRCHWMIQHHPDDTMHRTTAWSRRCCWVAGTATPVVKSNPEAAFPPVPKLQIRTFTWSGFQPFFLVIHLILQTATAIISRSTSFLNRQVRWLTTWTVPTLWTLRSKGGRHGQHRGFGSVTIWNDMDDDMSDMTCPKLWGNKQLLVWLHVRFAKHAHQPWTKG